MGLFSKLPIFGDEAVAKGTRKVMMTSYYGFKNREPGMPESWYMKMAVGIRYRSWSDMQLEVFVSDCNSIDELIEKIISQEKYGLI